MFDSTWGWFLARAIHVAGVVLWIGGVGFVTTALLPGIMAEFPKADQLKEFERYERRFGRHIRWVILAVGLSGFYMAENQHLWFRFATPGYGWMHAMVALWGLFMALLFVVEPLFFHRALQRLARQDPGRPMVVLRRMHRVLLLTGLLTTAWAVIGAHGG